MLSHYQVTQDKQQATTTVAALCAAYRAWAKVNPCPYQGGEVRMTDEALTRYIERIAFAMGTPVQRHYDQTTKQLVAITSTAALSPTPLAAHELASRKEFFINEWERRLVATGSAHALAGR